MVYLILSIAFSFVAFATEPWKSFEEADKACNDVVTVSKENCANAVDGKYGRCKSTRKGHCKLVQYINDPSPINEDDAIDACEKASNVQYVTKLSCRYAVNRKYGKCKLRGAVCEFVKYHTPCDAVYNKKRCWRHKKCRWDKTNSLCKYKDE